MNDSDVASSSDEEATDEQANPIQKCCYFLTETGHSLNFVLLTDNLTDSEVTEVTKLIELHMGTISTSKKDVTSNCAVLVDDKATSWDYSGDVFKLSYINDCITAGRLLDIAQYLKDPPSKLYVGNFDYMSVIYYRKFSWETIPSVHKLSKPAKKRQAQPREDSDSDSSVDSSCSTGSRNSFSRPQNFKQTKQQYSFAEKEAMIRYVVERKMFDRVKGKQLYKEMEAANICPIRTWQSLKDHFLRCLSKELSRFTFLTAQQRKKLQDALYPYR